MVGLYVEMRSRTIRTTSRKRTRMSDANVTSARVEVNERNNMNATSTSSAREMRLNNS